MELPEVAEFARNFAVMVRIQGPDPKGLKMQKHAFHHYHSGKTTLSASGTLLPNSLWNTSFKSGLVVTSASIVEPFLSMQYRENPRQRIGQLIPGAHIDVMVENKLKAGSSVKELDKENPGWLAAQLLALVDVPASSLALQTLIEAPVGSPELGSWEIGWSLDPLHDDPQAYMDAAKPQAGPINFLIENDKSFARNTSSNNSYMPRSTIRVAFLGVPSMTSEDVPDICTSPTNKRGNTVLAVGSPFGALSPVHFFNSVSVGSISNCYPPSSSNSSLLMSDIHCFPGMEGCPVFDDRSRFIGLLNRPLRQKAGDVEIQLVIPWEAIATAPNDLLESGTQKAGKIAHVEDKLPSIGTGGLSRNPGYTGTFNFNDKKRDPQCIPARKIENSMASIALLTADDGSWASGVLLNNHGLILTNAHLLEPWRFGRTSVHGEGDGTTSESLPEISLKPVAMRREKSYGQKKIHALAMLNISDTSLGDEGGRYKLGSVRKSYKAIRARLDHVKPSIWCDVRVVYVSQGILDIALLQLESVPNHLCPIIPDFTCPSPGSKTYVIGHGLFGPRSDLYPSIWSGVISQVVKSHVHLLPSEAGPEKAKTIYLPVMLETTAAVHSGASGGAVVNSDGHMIGLVTSNSRHGGGTRIPHLNFSIPSAALEPIFKFAADMQDLSILECLEKPHEHLASVWAFKIEPPSPRFVPPFHHQLQSRPEENNKEGKGSRFAKFIAERHGELFPQSNELPKGQKLPNKIISSKL